MYSDKDMECLADYDNKKSLKARFEASQNYIGEPEMVILQNKQTIDVRKYGDEIISANSSVQ